METTCHSCGHEFLAGDRSRLKSCPDRNALNPKSATTCEACGSSFEASFVLKLDEALRAGAIIRGMDLAEDKVKLGEQMATPVHAKILHSGDAQLVSILQILPEESFAHLKGNLDP